jgi:biotin-dependent carboxylase-like uncharacterized protein
VLDRSAYALANWLVGNPAGTAVLECTLGGLRVSFDRPAVVALTGTDAVLLVGGLPAAAGSAVPVPPGTEVAVTMPARGLRGYFAVAGGFDVPPVLGSRSTDALAGVGPARPAAGDALPIGPPPPWGEHPATGPSGRPMVPARAGVSSRAGTRAADPLPLTVDLGPRDDWFTDDAVRTFLGAEFTVAPASDAVGLRLDGPALARRRTEELPSEGVVRGSVQVPPDGHPIVFQADHPVTGGYPVIAVLHPAAADLAAQARPGDRIRFVLATDYLEAP